jgi:hypothetical protein
MRGRRIALGLLLAALLAASAGYVASGLRVYAKYQAIYRAYSLSCGGSLAWSPPPALYLGLYVNQPELVHIKVRSATPALAKVTVSIPGLTAPQLIETQSDAAFQSLSFKPSLLSDFTQDSLLVTGRRNAQIIVTAQIGGRTCQAFAPVTLFSRQWMVWRDPVTGADTTRYIAGWVTPRSPVIATLIGKASQRLANHPELYGGVPALYGYDGGHSTADQARNQVDALFDTLKSDYHVRYSSDNAPFTTSSAQIVQSPADVLSSASPTGMCVETTAILASAVERLGMRPYIVFTASHAYLGVALSAQAGAQIEYWETTDLNGAALGSQANVDGDSQYNADHSTHAVTAVVDVAYERSQGIDPVE